MNVKSPDRRKMVYLVFPSPYPSSKTHMTPPTPIIPPLLLRLQAALDEETRRPEQNLPPGSSVAVQRMDIPVTTADSTGTNIAFLKLRGNSHREHTVNTKNKHFSVWSPQTLSYFSLLLLANPIADGENFSSQNILAVGDRVLAVAVVAGKEQPRPPAGVGF